MTIDGQKISEGVKKQVRLEVMKLSKPPKLIVFSAGKNDANTAFVNRKKLFAADVGIILREVKLPSISTGAARKKILATLTKEKPTAAILQIPVPKNLDADVLLGAIPAELDVDALSSQGTPFLSPMVLAIKEVLLRNRVKILGANVVIVGAGRLVGQPAARFFEQKRATVTVCDEFTKNLTRATLMADILVTGAGAAHIITPNMVKRGVVAIDAGFSRQNGKIMGDIDPDVSKKASVYAGVPGGIGSMTVAYLFMNVVRAAKQQNKAQN